MMMFVLTVAFVMAGMFGEKVCPEFFGHPMVKKFMFLGAGFCMFVMVMHKFFA